MPKYLVDALRAEGQPPLILAERTTALRGPDPAGVLRCWTREPGGGDRLIQEIQQQRVQLLHVNYGGMFALDGWLPQLLRTVRRLGVRVVITFHTTESISVKFGELSRLADKILVHHAQNEIELLALEGTPGRTEVLPSRHAARRSPRHLRSRTS